MSRDIDILSLTYLEFLSITKERFNRKEYHAKATYRHIFKRGNLNFKSLEEYGKSGNLAEVISSQIVLPTVRVQDIVKTDVTKFTVELFDSSVIESVIIPEKSGNRTTLCVSSQVGCRMGCSFCETAKLGLKRNLTTSEIVAQVYLAKHQFSANITNIVFMGMGEPLDNFESVVKALEVLSQQHGFDIPYRRMTVSTSGVVKGINELVERGLSQKVKLAISLNGASDAIRQKIMPITYRYSIDELKESLKSYPLPKGGLFFIEYVLLKGVNDSPNDANMIIEFCKGINVMINLIPYNGVDYNTPSFEDINIFKDRLFKSGLFISVRTSRGGEISAACGQLAAKKGQSKL